MAEILGITAAAASKIDSAAQIYIARMNQMASRSVDELMNLSKEYAAGDNTKRQLGRLYEEYRQNILNYVKDIKKLTDKLREVYKQYQINDTTNQALETGIRAQHNQHTPISKS